MCICKGSVLPITVFYEDKELCKFIEDHCKRKKLEPIYIDRNYAIFKDYWLAAMWSRDLVKV